MAGTDKNYAGFWDRPMSKISDGSIITLDNNDNPATKVRRYSHFLLGRGIVILCLIAILLRHKSEQTLFSKYFNPETNCLREDSLSCELVSSIFTTEAHAQAFFYPLSLLFFLSIFNWIPFFLKKYNRPFHDIICGLHVVYATEKRARLSKTVLIVIIVPFLLPYIYLSFLTAYNIFDRPLNPEVEEFFYKNDFKLEDNVRVAWAGIHAPAGTKDIYEYGLKVYSGEIDYIEHLDFKGEINRDYLPDNTSNRTLPPAGYVETLYNDNKEFIERYSTFYNYKNFDAKSTLTHYGSGQSLISTNRLLSLHWEHMAQNGEGEKAIEWWLKDVALVQEMMGSNTGLVAKAIWMVNYGRTLRTLPFILKGDPSLIEKYEQPITEILSKNFMEDIWDVENTWRGEYNQLRFMQISKLPHHLLTIKPNDTRNEFLELTKNHIWLSKQPAYEIPNATSVLDKYEMSLIFPYNFVKVVLFSGFLMGSDMYINGHVITARHNALILWMQAHKQNIPPEKMEEFLQQAPESLHDTLTQKPLRWDSERNAIYLERYKNDSETRVNIFY